MSNQQENVQKKNISLLEDLPQLTEDKKIKKRD